jgi:peptide/nickel transport system permease protein
VATVTLAPPAQSAVGGARLQSRHATFRRRHPALWRFLHHRTGLIGAAVVLLVVLGSAGARWLAPHDPIAQNLAARFAGIGEQGYILGSDSFGRDMLSRLLWRFLTFCSP